MACRRCTCHRLRFQERQCLSSCDKQADVAVTHGHADHVGALVQLQAQFPELSIVMHAAEAPFVVGPAAQQAKYSSVPSDNTAYKALLSLLGPLTPRVEADAERTFLLSGPALPCSAVCQ